MTARKRWVRFGVHVLLTILAVVVWGYDVHLAVRPVSPLMGAEQDISIQRSAVPTTFYPWQQNRLPAIPWRMEAPLTVSTTGNGSSGPSIPDLELIGIFHAEGREAALLRLRDTDQTFLLRGRESAYGVTLVSADRDSVTLNSGSKSWRLALSSRRGGKE